MSCKAWLLLGAMPAQSPLYSLPEGSGRVRFLSFNWLRTVSSTDKGFGESLKIGVNLGKVGAEAGLVFVGCLRGSAGLSGLGGPSLRREVEIPDELTRCKASQ
jgi:hypothetical protein